MFENKLITTIAAEKEEKLNEEKIKYQLSAAILEKLKIQRFSFLHIFPNHLTIAHLKINIRRRDEVQAIFEMFDVLPTIKSKDQSPVFSPPREFNGEKVSPFIRRLGKNEEKIQFFARVPINPARRFLMQSETPEIAGLTEIQIQVECDLVGTDESLVVVQDRIQCNSELWLETQYWSPDRKPADIFGDYRNE